MFSSQLSNAIDIIGRIQLVVPSTEFRIDAPGGGVLAGGLLSTVALGASIFFSAIVLIWVGISAYAAYNIMRGYNDEQMQQKGMKSIKGIWIAVTTFFSFMTGLSFLGTFIGFGNVYEWSQNLSQCGDISNGFYFSAVKKDMEIALDDPNVQEVGAYCCVGTSTSGVALAEGWNIVISQSRIDQVDNAIANAPAGTISCEKFDVITED